MPLIRSRWPLARGLAFGLGPNTSLNRLYFRRLRDTYRVTMLPQRIPQILIGEGPYVSTSAEYRQSAELCLKAMRASANLETRAALVSLAQHWIKLEHDEFRLDNLSF